jgi:hypothetical protein
MKTSDTGEQGKDTLPEMPQAVEPSSAIHPACSSISPDADDLSRLHQFCWLVVREPLHATMTFRLAHCVMETICRWQPGNTAFLTALAMAQYRIGEYRSVLNTLAQSEKIMPGNPVCLAFAAMARFQLGDHDGSQVLLGRLQEMVHLPPWNQYLEAGGFLKEAQNLIRNKVTSER